MDKIYNTARETLRKKDVWKKMKYVCKNNSTGRSIFMQDALYEAVHLWIEKNRKEEK